jgi:hypothetical protein
MPPFLPYLPPLVALALLIVGHYRAHCLRRALTTWIKRDPVLRGRVRVVRYVAESWAANQTAVDSIISAAGSTIAVLIVAKSVLLTILYSTILGLGLTKTLWYIHTKEPDALVARRTRFFGASPARLITTGLVVLNLLTIALIAAFQAAHAPDHGPPI